MVVPRRAQKVWILLLSSRHTHTHTQTPVFTSHRTMEFINNNGNNCANLFVSLFFPAARMRARLFPQQMDRQRERERN